MSEKVQIGQITIHADIGLPDTDEERLNEIAEAVSLAIMEVISTEHERPLATVQAMLGQVEIETERLSPETRATLGIEEPEETPGFPTGSTPITEDEIREPTDKELSDLLGPLEPS